MNRFLLSAYVALGSSLFLCAQPKDQPIEPALKESDRRHWAFQQTVRPALPTVKSTDRVRNPIDRFVVAKWEEQGLVAAKLADPSTLLRRLAFDLTGLPPTPAEIDLFQKESDDKPQTAYERAVDRLLASPHYGERWAQHWLDVVRYAESNGYEGDSERPSAWRYRDYVVKSFNDDKPFDRFLTEQLAGDELAAGKEARVNAELWVATGIHRCGPTHVVSGNIDPEVGRQEVLTEMVMGVGSAFLGLTVNCARCHDHKFDPISQADYYRLEAFFAASQPKEIDFSTPEERTEMQKKLFDTMAKVVPIKTKVAALDAPYQKRIRERKRMNLEPSLREALDTESKNRSPDQQKLAKDAEKLLNVTWDEIVAALSPEDRQRRTTLREEQHALEAELPMPPSQAWAIADDDKRPATHILQRGEIKKKGAVVQPAFPRVLGIETKRDSQIRFTRKDLAAWMTSPDHPLTARVFVNRLWQHHFGRGIVGTPNDFGIRGERPTHPELLDWLAVEFVRSGWKIKPMHKLMVMSNTYRLASKADGVSRSKDPENRFLWRMNRRRLEGEALRDAILTAAGTLNRNVGGPMVRVPLEPEIYDLIFTEGEPDGLWPVTKDATQHTRRSIYLFAKRNVRQPLLEAFDQPDSLTPCANRAVSTYAPQALILMNGPFAQTQSRAMAQRMLKELGDKPDRWIEEAYRRCFGRRPRHEERQFAREFLHDQAETVRSSETALADFCLALFNTNEFVYVP